MIEINLLPRELQGREPKFTLQAAYILYITRLACMVLVIINLFLSVNLGAKYLQLNVCNAKWKRLERQRAALDSLRSEYDLLSTDSKIVQQLTDQRVNWAEKLNKLSLLLPDGVWFNELTLSQNELKIQGSVVSLDRQHMLLINKLMESIKNDQPFFNDFSGLELSSVLKRTLGPYDVVDFDLSAPLTGKADSAANRPGKK